MALIKTVLLPDGNALTYHRIDHMQFALPGQPVKFRVESYLSREAREQPGAFKAVSEWAAIVQGPSTAVQDSYASLLLAPQWSGATSDEAGGTAVAEAVVFGTMTWDTENQVWVDADPEPTIQQLIEAAQIEIDNAAGQKRAAYIPNTPGQEVCFYAKWVDAKAWVAAGYSGDVPPFVQAEVNATGDPAQQVANAHKAVGDFIFISRFPAIEAARVAGYLSLQGLGTPEEVQSALAQALANIEAA